MADRQKEVVRPGRRCTDVVSAGAEIGLNLEIATELWGVSTSAWWSLRLDINIRDVLVLPANPNAPSMDVQRHADRTELELIHKLRELLSAITVVDQADRTALRAGNRLAFCDTSDACECGIHQASEQTIPARK